MIIVQAYPEQLDNICNFQGETKLLLKDAATPFIYVPRKVLHPLKTSWKKELENMTE